MDHSTHVIVTRTGEFSFRLFRFACPSGCSKYSSEHSSEDKFGMYTCTCSAPETYYFEQTQGLHFSFGNLSYDIYLRYS